MVENTYYKYKRIKYQLIAETLKKELKNYEKTIDKRQEICYNKDTN